MPGTKCPTVRSAGTTSVRSALMPILMKSRASMGCFRKTGVVPALRRDPYRVMPRSRQRCRTPAGKQQAPVAMGPCVRRDDERWEPALLLRRRRALHKRLAALHLVGQRRFVDLDHDRIGIDAEVLDQRLGDVAHHAGLLFVGATEGHAHGDLRHCGLSLFCFRHGRTCSGHPRPFPSNKTWMGGPKPGRASQMNSYPHLTSWRASTSRTFATISPSAQENCAGRVSRHSWLEAIAAAAFAPSIRSLIWTSPRAFSSEPWIITQGELRRSAYLSWLPMFLGLPR